MNKLKNSNRIFILPIIVALVFGLIIMPAIMPIIKVDPKDVPIGLVVTDEGDIGTTLAEELPKNAPDIVKFIQYDSMKDLKVAMDEREVYGALELPSDFSSKVATLQTDSPQKATANIYINEGANMSAATLTETALTNMVAMLNKQLSTQMLTAVEDQTEQMKEQLEPVLQAQEDGSPLAEIGDLISPIQPSKVQDFANPIVLEVIKVHETGDLGNAPTAFLTITWIVSLIGAVMLYLAGTDRTFRSKAEKMKFNTIQSVMPFVYALATGYVATWYSTWILGFEFESFNRVALYIAICIAAFTFMIFATLRWLKLPSIAIFIVLMFFSMAAVQMPAEMMPAFYRDYIFSWLPLRIYADGLKEVLFFSKDLINSYSSILIWILIIGLVLVWIKNIIEKTHEQET